MRNHQNENDVAYIFVFLFFFVFFWIFEKMAESVSGGKWEKYTDNEPIDLERSATSNFC